MVLYGGVHFGTNYQPSNGTGLPSPGSFYLTFNANATAEAVQALVRWVGYQVGTSSYFEEERYAVVVLRDGDGLVDTIGNGHEGVHLAWPPSLSSSEGLLLRQSGAAPGIHLAEVERHEVTAKWFTVIRQGASRPMLRKLGRGRSSRLQNQDALHTPAPACKLLLRRQFN